MEFFKDTHFRFMRYRRFFAVVSGAVALASIVGVFAIGHLNVGIDFTGGTQVIVRFQEAPTSDELRDVLEERGIEDAQIQRFGTEESDEMMIRAPLASQTEEGGRAREIIDALDAVYNEDTAGSFDLNLRGSDALAGLLFEEDPEGLARNDEALAREHYGQVAETILGLRQDTGIFTGWEEIEALDAVGPEVAETLREEATLGSFALLGEEIVGPSIGAELRQKGLWAVALSLLGILGYIWVRFELRFGVGALMALLHDVTIMLGIYALAGHEFNLSTIAAFLTLVGYSVNDTVVVFDRVRENMRRSRRQPLEKTIDESINQTLSRTALTSGTTLLAVTSLYVFGGEVLRGFSFVLVVGVIIGTYSSIFVASPFTLFWEHITGGESRRKRARA